MASLHQPDWHPSTVTVLPPGSDWSTFVFLPLAPLRILAPCFRCAVWPPPGLGAGAASATGGGGAGAGAGCGWLATSPAAGAGAAWMPDMRNCSETQPTTGDEIAHQPGTGCWPPAWATRPAAIFTPQPPTTLTCAPFGMVVTMSPAGRSRTLRMVIAGSEITTVAAPATRPQVLVVG